MIAPLRAAPKPRSARNTPIRTPIIPLAAERTKAAA